MNTEYYPQFFTATILNWENLLQFDEYKLIILDSLKFLVKENRIKVYAYVIMPNHIHLIWQISDGFKKERVQQSFLKYTAQQIKFDLLQNRPEFLIKFQVNSSDRHFQFWERNPLSIDLYSPNFFEQKLNYVHNNPIQDKWKLAVYPEAYRWSSASFYEMGVDEFNFLSHHDDGH